MHRCSIRRFQTSIPLAIALIAGLAACQSRPASINAETSDTDAISELRPGSFAIIDDQAVPVPPVPMGSHATVRRVIQLAKTDSRVMEQLTGLCEGIGTRLTGSSACYEANLWTRDRFDEWGLADARIEQWGTLDARFDRLASEGAIVAQPRSRGRDQDGSNDNAGATEPEWNTVRELEFTTLSWTRGTDGPTVGRVIRMPETLEEAESMADDLSGAWVLLPAFYSDRRGVRGVGYSMRGRNDIRKEVRAGEYDPFESPPVETWTGTVTHGETPLDLTFLPERDDEGSIVGGVMEIPGVARGEISDVFHDDDSLRLVWNNPVENAPVELTIDGETMTGTGGADKHPVTLTQTVSPDDRGLTRDSDKVLARVLEADPAGFLSPSRDDRVWTTRPNGWRETDPDDLPRDIEISIRRSDYDYINSRLADGQEIHARFDLQHSVDPGPVPVFNTIAEIRGSTRPEEVVIVSAHLDSWDGPGSQGVVDNGTGSSVVLEAARLLSEANARPDRTIRFILWTGEEQGLLGSRAYVDSLSEEERARISAVFVDDGGTNYQGGLPAADHMVEYLAAATAPLNNEFYSPTDDAYLNVNVRPTGETLKTHGGSDHAPFNRVGVPGFFWDEVGRANYRYAWHTQNDRIDQAIEEYLVQSSACMAITAYNLACAPALLPREGESTEQQTANAAD